PHVSVGQDPAGGNTAHNAVNLLALHKLEMLAPAPAQRLTNPTTASSKPQKLWIIRYCCGRFFSDATYRKDNRCLVSNRKKAGRFQRRHPLRRTRIFSRGALRWLSS